MSNDLSRLAAALADRYVVERELGHGGMATVYLVRDLKHDRSVALKVLYLELSEALGSERRFLREIKTAARLEHPHILPVLDSGEAQGQLWYTMPFVEGESLRDRLRREGPLPITEAVRLTREVAEALEYAHGHGIVHRDIKPENILLSGGHARVADFGIAKALEAAGSETLTVSGMMVGTPQYMSPEQAAGEHELDGRSDVYSLGCVLYELLAGEPPWSGPTPLAVLARRFTESPRSLGAARAGLPEALEQAVTQALARTPAERFQTAAEFARALAGTAAYPAPVPPVSQAPVVPPTTRPPERRRRRLTITVLAVGFVLGLGVLFAWLRSDSATESSSNPKLIAVLPFENLGDSAEAYFVDGVSDAVRGKLAALPGLRVIAGTSSGEYRRTTKSPREIARELGVRYLLVGKVRREGELGGQGRVRVSPELVEVRPRGAATTRWQEPFEVPVPDVFRVQADIASGVAEALGVALGAGERLQVAERPTQNLAAYDAYLKGEQVSGGVSTAEPVTLRRALPYYEQAVALDSAFVEAWAQLSLAHSLIYINGTPLPAEAEAAHRAAERALALAPDRAEGRLALGNYYISVLNESQRALEQYALGLRLAPSNAVLLTHAAFAEQNLGRWEAALEHFRQAQALDPRSVTTAGGLARASLWLRRYPEVLRATERGLALAPASLRLLQTRAMAYLGQGDLAGARAVIRAAPQEIEPTALVAYMGYYWDLYWVLDRAQQALLLQLAPGAFDNNRSSWGLVLAQTYALRADQVRARAYADSARLALEDQLRAAPQDAQLHVLYGLTLAYLGRKAEAVREGERGVALQPVSKDAFGGAYFQNQLVRIYLLVGEPEKALDQLEPLLKIPYHLSPGWLRIDPTFEPLRDNPRFERLLATK
jgi:eukaryotic-like serine/threonine-protein kinase